MVAHIHRNREWIHFTPRFAHRTAALDSAGSEVRSGALPLPMEFACDGFGAQSHDGLLRRKLPVQVDRPGRYLETARRDTDRRGRSQQGGNVWETSAKKSADG